MGGLFKCLRHRGGVTGIPFQREVARDVGMQLRCIGLQGIFRIDNHRQITVFNTDRTERITRQSRGLGHHHGYGFTDKTHTTVGQYRPLGLEDARASAVSEVHQVGKMQIAGGHCISPGQHRHYARTLQRLCRVDGNDIGMRVVATQKSRV